MAGKVEGGVEPLTPQLRVGGRLIIESVEGVVVGG